MHAFTYILNFSDEGVNVVPGIVVVQAVLVHLYLLTNEVKEGLVVAEKFVVRTRQVLHHSRE